MGSGKWEPDVLCVNAISIAHPTIIKKPPKDPTAYVSSRYEETQNQKTGESSENYQTFDA
jgi:hypothetical protein